MRTALACCCLLLVSTCFARPMSDQANKRMLRAAQPAPATQAHNSATYQPATLQLDWSIGWITAAPDGFSRRVLSINGMWPTPTIKATAGDRLIITVTNNADEPTSIHWHGIDQLGTNGMDGASYVSQAPIMPGASFVYDFIVNEPGSYWYHSHFGSQYVDGLRGALVVYDPAEAGLYEVDEIVTLTDWYHDLSDNLMKVYLSPASGGDEPIPFSALLNSVGQGSNDCAPSSSGSYSGYSSSYTSSSSCQYATVIAQDSTCDKSRTRLRIINISAFASFNFTIDETIMQLITVDGAPVSPVQIGHLRINSGQRYDVTLCRAPSHSSELVWMRAAMDQSVFPDASTVTSVFGVLSYGGPSNGRLPTTQLDLYGYGLNSQFVDPYMIDPNGLVPTKAVHGQPLGQMAPADKQFTLQIDFIENPSTEVVLASFNKVTWNVNNIKTPLIDLYKAGKPYPNMNILSVDENDVVRVIINNNDTGEHPIHLHGRYYAVLAHGFEGDGFYDPAKHPLNLVNPLLRDTATVNANSYLVIQFKATNPGVWYMHCHIDWHMNSGLAMAWSIGQKTATGYSSSSPPPPTGYSSSPPPPPTGYSSSPPPPPPTGYSSPPPPPPAAAAPPPPYF